MSTENVLVLMILFGISVFVYLVQWFLTLLEVLNPESFISAFTEPFIIGKIKYNFFKNIGMYFISAQNEQCISCTQNHCVQRTKPTKHEFQKMVLLKIILEFLTSAESLRLAQRTPGVQSNPG